MMLVVLATPTLVFAEPPGTKCSVPQAVTSPCSGVLLPTDAAEEGLRCLRLDVPKLALELKYQKDLLGTQKTYYDLLIEAEKTRSTDLTRQIDILMAKPLPQKSIFDNKVLWTVIGVALGAGATIGIAYALPRN
jgi:hypothetical protein